MPASLSRHQRHRLSHLADRLFALFDIFDAVADRRAPLPDAIAAPIRRVLDEGERLLDLPPSARRQSALPGDLFVATMAILDEIKARFREANQRPGGDLWKTYPRSPEQE